MKIIIQNGISSVRALFPPLRRAPHTIIPHPSSLALDIRVTFINNYLFFTRVGGISRRSSNSRIIRVATLQYTCFVTFVTTLIVSLARRKILPIKASVKFRRLRSFRTKRSFRSSLCKYTLFSHNCVRDTIRVDAMGRSMLPTLQ